MHPHSLQPAWVGKGRNFPPIHKTPSESLPGKINLKGSFCGPGSLIPKRRVVRICIPTLKLWNKLLRKEKGE
jgi:hypothetical protein